MKRAFLLCALLLPMLTAFAARVGILTDTHVGFQGKKASIRLERCYRLFKAHKVDMIFHLGDIAEEHNPAFYREYAAVRDKVYPAGCPPEKFVFATHDRIGHVQKAGDPFFADAYADVRRMLGIGHDRFHRFELEGFTFLLYPQARPHERVEAEVAAECAAHPGRPLFVLDHVPPLDTVNGSEFGGKSVLHGIFKNHPEVIVLTGHVHGSLAHEGKIWQGEYTALNFGAQKGDSVPDAPQMAAIMELTPEKAVFRRYDTKTGREWRGVTPWTLTFPFDPQTAPYRPAVRAAQIPAPTFASDAKLGLVRLGEPLTAVEVTFPAAATPEVATYLVAVKVRSGTNWVVRSEQSCRADYATESTRRRKEFKARLASGHFDSGETVRISVAPQDFYRRIGPAIESEFDVGTVEPWTVVCEAVPTPAKKGEWLSFKGDRTSFEIAADAFLELPAKTPCRLVMEAAVDVSTNRFARFSGLLGPGGGSAWQRFYSPRGTSLRRYVIPMTPGAAGKKTLTLALEKAGRGRIRIDAFKIECKGCK